MRSISKLGVLPLTFCLLLATAGLCFGADATANSGPPDGKQPPPPPTAAQMKEDLSKSLEQLVTDKLISQKQKTTVLEYYGKLFTKINGQDPRKMMETFDQLKKSAQDPASLLVKDGILTKEQAAAVGKLFPPQPPKGQPGNGPGGNRPPPPPTTSQRERFEGPPLCEAGPMFFGAGFVARQGPWSMGNGQEGGGRLMPPPPPRKMDMMERIRERLNVLTIAKIITEQQAESVLKSCRAFWIKGRRGGPGPGPGMPQLGEAARESQGMNNPPPAQTLNDKDKARPEDFDLQGQSGLKKPQASQELPKFLAQMVKDGVINREQADILIKVLDLSPARQARR